MAGSSPSSSFLWLFALLLLRLRGAEAVPAAAPAAGGGKEDDDALEEEE